MKSLFDELSAECSQLTTSKYSTSFSLGTRLLSGRFRAPVHAIYGFVRLADEIVDSFHDFKKEELLKKFWAETHSAIKDGISLNPILNSFQKVYREYDLSLDMVDSFMKSMAMDLVDVSYDKENYETYIYGSAEVVGLMCLKVFTENNESEYLKLKPYAKRLGAAFQKVNFLRDLKADTQQLGRNYFPHIDFNTFDASTKQIIEAEIAEDFKYAYEGICMLPKDARFGVYIAYTYYMRLFDKIGSHSADRIMEQRIRISNTRKYSLLVHSYFKHSLNLL